MANKPPRNGVQATSPKYLSEIDNYVESLQDTLWPLNKFIHDHPELAFNEHKAHDALTNFMRLQKGWVVTPHAFGIETAWAAIFNTGRDGPAISFNVEMDALPGIGHACGHNLIATASVAAALATAHILSTQNLPGSIHLIGTPGEENPSPKGGKVLLLEAGAYDHLDITLISHPCLPNNSALVRTTAFARLEVSYFGKASHAANSPWLGINALDALIIAYNAVGLLRQQLRPDDIVGMHITNGGAAPNIIHAYAAGALVLRAPSSARLLVLQQKIEACLRAGAEATGARVEVKVTPGYADHIPNRVLAASYTQYFNALPNIPDPPIPSLDTYTYVKASTDQGNLSYVLPSINASFSIPPGPEGGANHSRDFEVASGTREAFGRAVRVGKALAGTAVEVCCVEGMLRRVRDEWKRDVERAGDGVSGGMGW
ncbi:putative amidohydrolase [Paraphaeosphaeria sporulosa]|uniref:Peptidase M20 domain-containing protein 2 n=1 Tax=Paraphaeosphaeria sporulosa TaxID=1460663 RepID=A0A177CTP3_9PLEO|nr:putative amidohydrolase [Paraphaeosphaeria sporulosa]OAG10119.1 putative amidohydrolase [Paraphaeosphaeria sporulosa]